MNPQAQVTTTRIHCPHTHATYMYSTRRALALYIIPSSTCVPSLFSLTLLSLDLLSFPHNTRCITLYFFTEEKGDQGWAERKENHEGEA